VSAIRIHRALLSVSDKTGLVEFAHGLVRHGAKILSTGGSATTLRGSGISVRDVSEVTGFPELFEGRVKTLHPSIHGGILYRRGFAQDEEERHRHGIVSIDLVAVNLYPFEKTVLAAGVSEADAIEQIDIGGPALTRAAAKNWPHVLIVVSPDQYAEVLEALDRGGIPQEMARRYAARAFERTAAYDATIARYLGERVSVSAAASGGGSGSGVGPSVAGLPGAVAAASGGDGGAALELPESIELRYRLRQRLRYGENPGQEGALYTPANSEGSLQALTQLRGKTLSYNNLLDVEAALLLLHELPAPAAVVVKHRNPSGAAVVPPGQGANLVGIAEAILRARDGDQLSAFGGILGMNAALDDAALDAIGSFFYEVVLAPAITASQEKLAALRKNLVVLEVPDLLRGAAAGWSGRTLLGGFLAETTPRSPAFESWKTVTKREPTAEERDDLRFGWRVARHVVSNAIVVTRGGRTLGIGAGQSSRVDSVRLALEKAKRSGHEVRGAALCSDAFFPFPDSVEIAAQAGIRAIAHPGGSVRDAESVRAADDAGMAMVLTGERCFLH
jgi:phosphoribosylaminoimidazolecarboxamide formyltransferase/IMP cyclohydrolase